jgi:hypothetical protein
MTDYTRVIPRDFFNEAKLLKCMGMLSLKILDRQLPDGIEIEVKEDGDPFNIQLTDDGLLFIANYPVKVNRKNVFFGSTYNSKRNFPLLCVISYVEYTVFNEDGTFTEEFINQFSPIKNKL